MPRYYVDTYDHFAAIDEVGHDFPDRDAVRQDVCRALGEMMRDEKICRPSVQFRADVRDAAGKSVMRATLLMVIEETDNRPPGR